MTNLSPSEQAHKLIHYFSGLDGDVKPDPDNLEIARSWLKLLNRQKLSKADADNMLDMVRESPVRSCAWEELKYHVEAWVNKARNQM